MNFDIMNKNRLYVTLGSGVDVEHTAYEHIVHAPVYDAESGVVLFSVVINTFAGGSDRVTGDPSFILMPRLYMQEAPDEGARFSSPTPQGFVRKAFTNNETLLDAIRILLEFNNLKLTEFNAGMAWLAGVIDACGEVDLIYTAGQYNVVYEPTITIKPVNPRQELFELIRRTTGDTGEFNDKSMTWRNQDALRLAVRTTPYLRIKTETMNVFIKWAFQLNQHSFSVDKQQFLKHQLDAAKQKSAFTEFDIEKWTKKPVK